MSEGRDAGPSESVPVHGGDDLFFASAGEREYPRIPSPILAKSPPPRCPPVVLVKRLLAAATGVSPQSGASPNGGIASRDRESSAQGAEERPPCVG